MQRYDVFISYNRNESPWRDLLAKRLADMSADRNINAFVDENDIPTGDEWEEAIERAIRQVDVVVILASKAWNKSEFCKGELELALRHKKKLIWTSIDGCKPRKLSKVNASALLDDGLRAQPDSITNAAITEICESVLSRIDPYQRKLQRKLPPKYRLIRKLGEGATCAVYMAADRSLDRRVSVRMVKNPKDNDIFDTAVRRAAGLGRHSSFITVYGAWLDNDPHCCVMDYVSGKSLEEHLRNRTWRWNAEDAVKLILQLGEALDGAHGQGFHHRDIRPSKVFIDDTNSPFVLGVVSPQNAVGDALLEHARDHGSNFKLDDERIAYLVPEHFYPLDEGGKEQADQYLLGLIAYHVLSRTTPDVVENKSKVSNGTMPRFKQPTPLQELVPACPTGLTQVIEKMIMVSPRDRYGNLAEAMDALRGILPIGLTLARESYLRCVELEREFFEAFYERFRATCKPARKMFKDRGFNESGDLKWQRQHEMLKEAILLLLAYRRVQSFHEAEPNLLTRIAKFHAEQLDAHKAWYDSFVVALLETVSDHDRVCKKDRNRRPYILQAWRSAVWPGIKYMQLQCAK